MSNSSLGRKSVDADRMLDHRQFKQRILIRMQHADAQQVKLGASVHLEYMDEAAGCPPLLSWSPHSAQ